MAAEVEVVYELVRANLVGRALDDDVAVVHHRDPLGHAERDVHVVLDQDERDVAFEAEKKSVRSRRSPRARPEAGSSSMRIRGSATSAIASATWRCSPWERFPTSSPSLWSIATRPAAARARLAKLPVLLRECDRTDVATTHPERRKVDAVLDGEPEEHARLLVRARETELRALRAGIVVTSRPNSSTVPLDAWRSPAMTLKRVVFPAPLGPRIA